jgi:hypothetical protein
MNRVLVHSSGKRVDVPMVIQSINLRQLALTVLHTDSLSLVASLQPIIQSAVVLIIGVWLLTRRAV